MKTSRLSVIAVYAFSTLVPLLRFDRECGDRARFQPTQRDWLASFLAITVGAVLDTPQCLIDLGDELALAVTRAQFDCAVGFRGRAMGNIGGILIFFLY